MDLHKKVVFVNGFDLSLVLNLAISTAKIRKLTVQRDNDTLQFRPQMHCILFGAMGSTKSQILSQIASKFNTSPTIGFSPAGLYGTVDKNTGVLIPPMIWEARNGVLAIDEFTFTSNSPHSVSTVQAMLPVLEQQFVKKKVGYRANTVKEKDGDLYLHVEDGTIECKTRFVAIINTMMNLKCKSSQWLDALKSRCLVIPHYPDITDLHKIARDGTFYDFKLTKTKTEVVVKKEDYFNILDIVESSYVKSEDYLRLVGDCVRAFAVTEKHDEELYKLIIKIRQSCQGGRA